jgi:hypothetical protein
VVDGAESQPYTSVGAQDLLFSPDSRRVAYVVQEQTNAWRVVLDGKPGQIWESIAVRPFTFSADSRDLAFVASRTNKFLLVANGQPSGPYDRFLLNPHGPNTLKSLELLAVKPGTNSSVQIVRLVVTKPAEN